MCDMEGWVEGGEAFRAQMAVTDYKVSHVF